MLNARIYHFSFGGVGIVTDIRRDRQTDRDGETETDRNRDAETDADR